LREDVVGAMSTSPADASASGFSSREATLERAPKSGEGRPVPMAREVALALLKLREISP
jgi:hypothetical protein